MSAEHSPLPWVAEGCHVRDAQGVEIAFANNYLNDAVDNRKHKSPSPPEARANAALMVRAVNRYHLFDEVVKAAKKCLPALEIGNGNRGWNIEALRVAANLRAALDALAKAGGKE